MKSLYSRLADQWNILFPPDPQRTAYLHAILKKSCARIVEVGCGSGATAISLASLGHSVSASDLDDDMIQVARKAAGNTVEFAVDDMISALGKVSNSSTHAILCLGNTLPHLTRDEELKQFFQVARACLVPGGTLVIQILNYCQMMTLGRVELPDIAGDGLIFRRKQTFNKQMNLVTFDTEVISGKLRERRRHHLRPVTPDDLSLQASRSGLKLAGVYGDWKGRRFLNDDAWLVSLFTRTGEGS